MGYAPCATKKTPFTERPPFLPTVTQWPPIFDKLLVTERPWHVIFVTQRPSFSHQIVKQMTIFCKKFGFLENFDKFDQMLRKFWPFWPWKSLSFNAFHWKTPYFGALCHWKTPFFDAICHRKTPTSEVLGGTSLSYVSSHPHSGFLIRQPFCLFGQCEIQNNPTMHYDNSNNTFLVCQFWALIRIIIEVLGFICTMAIRFIIFEMK